MSAGNLVPVTDPHSVACKICGGASPLFGVVDFNRTCIGVNGKQPALSGIPIYYRRCAQCGFLFTTACDDWPPDAFARYIYNQDYRLVDPDYESARPTGNARLIDQWFAGAKASIRLLDYGSGSGVFATLLRQSGYVAASYDPFAAGDCMPAGKFNVITSFEVLEHSHKPRETVAEIVSYLAQGGIIVFTTLVQPADFDARGLDWWYIGPRNGHISIHSRASLAQLFGTCGFNVASDPGGSLHIAFTTVPDFAAHVLATQANRA